MAVNLPGRLSVNLLGIRYVVCPAHCFSRPYAWRATTPTDPAVRACADEHRNAR